MLSDDSDNDEYQLTINEHYAKAYAYRKEREELQKLKEKYGSDIDEVEDEEPDSEDFESEDEDGEELTPAVDAAILRTLARIKRKDPEIYESGKSIFEEEQQKSGSRSTSKRSAKTKQKSKPVTIRQQALEYALNPTSRSPSPQPATHAEEQRALRSETVAAFHHAIDEEDDDLLIPREKTKDEIEREEEEYREYLQREVGDIKDLIVIESEDTKPEHDAEVKPKETKSKKKAKKSKQEEDQLFLMNYILNRGWIDRSARRLPTYGEIIGSDVKGKGKSKAREEEESSQPDDEEAIEDDEDDEEEFEEVAERFETSYNFRFEEPDAASIKSFPRSLGGLVRREENSRKEARERKKQRKEEELLQKREEMKRLKALKMKELNAKLERIGREGGFRNVDESKLAELDLDTEWDPEKHDKQMAGIYADDADEDAEDEDKPIWDDDIDIGDIVPDEDDGKKKKKKKKKQGKKDKDAKDDGGVDLDEMDADNLTQWDEDDEQWDGTEEMRKSVLDKYMDELYGMEFNDVIGGMPTRFKYTKVAPQNFALSPAEILMATDAELNQYMGVKQIAPYRKGIKWDNKRGEKLKDLKHKLAERKMPGTGTTADVGLGENERPAKKRMGKKERQKAKAAAATQGADGEYDDDDQEASVGQRDGTDLKRQAADASPEIEEAPAKKRQRRQKSFS